MSSCLSVYLLPTRRPLFWPPTATEGAVWREADKKPQSSSDRTASPASPAEARSTGRPSPPTPPGGPKTAIRRRAAQDRAQKAANTRPSSTRAAGAGGSSSTMLSMLCLVLS